MRRALKASIGSPQKNRGITDGAYPPISHFVMCEIMTAALRTSRRQQQLHMSRVSCRGTLDPGARDSKRF